MSQSFTEQELAEALRRLHSDGPWYTTQQVQDHLASLERGRPAAPTIDHVEQPRPGGWGEVLSHEDDPPAIAP